MQPGHLVPEIWSPHLVPNAYGPRTFGPPQLVPQDKQLPTISVKLSLEYFVCPGVQAVGILKYGDHFYKGTICPWGPFIQGDQFYGDRLSRGTGSGKPEVQGSNGFGTSCVAAHFLMQHIKL